MMPPMTPSSTSSAPVPPMACPHCSKPLMISKPPMAGLSDADESSDPMASPSKPPMAKPMHAKKKNAANMPMDELKNVIKSSEGK